MTPEEFAVALKSASDTVKTWPKWKQNILKDSLSPTVPVPRTPVDNSDARYRIKTNNPIAKSNNEEIYYVRELVQSMKEYHYTKSDYINNGGCSFSSFVYG